MRYELVDEYRRASEGQGFYLSSLADFLSAFDVAATVVDEVRVEEMVAAELSGGTSDGSRLEKLRLAATTDPLEAFIEAISYLEEVASNFAKKIGGLTFNRLARRTLFTHRFYARFGLLIPEPLSSKLHAVRMGQQLYENGRFTPEPADVDRAVEVIIEFERFLNSLDIDQFRQRAKEWADKGQRKFGHPVF